MARLVVVSNRLSLPRERGSRAGGLSVAMREALRRSGGAWFGWSGEIADQTSSVARVETVGRTTYATVDLSAADHDAYYNGYSNGTLWPLLHYRLGLLVFRRDDFEGYLRVNARMAAALRPLLRPDDLIWVHDYQMIPLGRALRRLGIEQRIGFFLHTPFPAATLFEALPGHEQLLEAFAAYDLVGLQTRSDLQAFADCMAPGAPRDAGERRFDCGERVVRAGAFPIGIDGEAFAAMAERAARSADSERLKASLGGRALIIGVDRLDYSKGLPNRFAAFGNLLSLHAELRKQTTFLQIAPRSRTELAHYRTLRRELESLAGRINSKYAEVDWVPLRYMNKSIARPTLAGYYRLARVGLVTPFRDGMNLVAKEYVAAQDPADPGVLVLSRFAGAAQELTGALIVNPHDIDAIAEALGRALTMPREDRRARWQAMMASVRANSITHWRDSFIAALTAARDSAPQQPELDLFREPALMEG